MPPRKKTTIKDVAREANVSISVVSYVLNQSTKKTISEATKERVLEAASRLQYVPNRTASGMRKRKSLALGVVSYWELEGMVFTHMLKGISQAASGSRYSVVLCHQRSEQDDYEYLNYFLDGTIDGIIFIAPHESLGLIDEGAHIARMRQAGAPFVVMNGSTREEGVSYINIDFYGSAYMAASYLIGRGHKEIAYVAPLSVRYIELAQRYQGYCDAMDHNGLPRQAWDVTELTSCIRKLKAVVANKSDTAHAVMEEALRQGVSIPGDLALIAANTEAYSPYLFPPLSTVRIPAEKMGELAAQTLLKQIQGETEVVSATLPCTLEIRQSC